MSYIKVGFGEGIAPLSDANMKQLDEGIYNAHQSLDEKEIKITKSTNDIEALAQSVIDIDSELNSKVETEDYDSNKAIVLNKLNSKVDLESYATEIANLNLELASKVGTDQYNTKTAVVEARISSLENAPSEVFDSTDLENSIGEKVSIVDYNTKVTELEALISDNDVSQDILNLQASLNGIDLILDSINGEVV